VFLNQVVSTGVVYKPQHSITIFGINRGGSYISAYSLSSFTSDTLATGSTGGFDGVIFTLLFLLRIG
jgi:hypothetical protein